MPQRTRPSSKRSRPANGSSRSTTCCSPVDPRASAACFASSPITRSAKASSNPSPPTPPYINTIPASRRATVSRQPRDRAPHQEPRSLERAGDGRQGEQGRRWHRRAHLDLRVGRDALRSRLQPFLQGEGRRSRRRHHLLPGTRVARHLRPRVRRRTNSGGEARELPPRAEAGRRSVVVSASVADAGLLGIPDGLDGARAHLARSTRRASCATSRIAV